MRFDDLPTAGRLLAAELEQYRGDDTVVIAIAAGGVPVALEVARHLSAPFDLLFRKTLFFSRGQPVGIANVAGTPIYGALEASTEDSSVPTIFIQDAIASFEQRVNTCRGSAQPLSVTGNLVLLVDDGIRTASTVTAAVAALRPLEPRRVVLAAVVASPDSRPMIEREVDETVIMAWPSPFGHVGMFFRRFDVPNDLEVRHMFEERRQQP